MAEILSGSIDLSKIDKSKIVEKKLKDGSTAKFLNINIAINNEVDQYGNVAGLTISQTQEERQAKNKEYREQNKEHLAQKNTEHNERNKENSRV
jgi:predicted ATP-dependent protease